MAFNSLTKRVAAGVFGLIASNAALADEQQCTSQDDRYVNKLHLIQEADGPKPNVLIGWPRKGVDGNVTGFTPATLTSISAFQFRITSQMDDNTFQKTPMVFVSVASANEEVRKSEEFQQYVRDVAFKVQSVNGFFQDKHSAVRMVIQQAPDPNKNEKPFQVFLHVNDHANLIFTPKSLGANCLQENISDFAEQLLLTLEQGYHRMSYSTYRSHIEQQAAQNKGEVRTDASGGEGEGQGGDVEEQPTSSVFGQDLSV